MNRCIHRFSTVFCILMALSLISFSLTQAGDERNIDGSEGKAFESKSYEQLRSDIFKGDKENETDTITQSKYLPVIWCEDISDEETKTICWKAYAAGLQYYQDGLHQRLSVLWWNQLTTKIIFFTVLVLVFLGVYFSWIQFQRSLIHSQTGDGENHSVEISTSGVKVSSPVLGVIILTLSLAFFYLYLVYVYPVKEIF